MVYSLVSIIVFVLITLTLYKIFKSVKKTIKLMILFLLIFLAVLGFFVFRDVKDLKENFESSPKLFLLKDKTEFLTGIKIESFTFGEDATSFLTEEEIKNLKGKSYEEILGENYKLFIIDIILLERMPEQMSLEEIFLSKEKVLEVLKAEDALSILEIPGEVENKKLKAFIFVIALQSIVEEKGPFFLFEEYKKDNLIIYPETIVFKLVRLVPTSLVKNIYK